MANFKRYSCRRALISVADKTGIVGFTRQLRGMGMEVLSTGGTAALLSDHDIDVTQVSDYTGFPEIMDGRVKTLHPKIHGGILGRCDRDEEVMHRHGIAAIDLIIVNLYPFAKIVADPDNSFRDAVENIDIGGVALLRAAAKNHARVIVVVNPADYGSIVAGLKEGNGRLGREKRFELAVKAFDHTAQYDRTIADYLGGRKQQDSGGFPRELTLSFQRAKVLRYGENPHQRGAFYIAKNPPAGSGIATTETIQGGRLSYNNVADADAALECVRQFSSPTCVIVKHANPCGVATGATILQAYERAREADPTSAFGGIVAVNRELGADAAKAVAKQFIEVIIAPDVADAARKVLALKKNLRVLEYSIRREMNESFDYKSVAGGLLVQDRDTGITGKDDVKIVTARAPSNDEIEDLLFAWKVVKFVKSNAIVYARNQQTLGVGAGQMSRVYSAKIAAMKAQDEKLGLGGAVMASDAFIPFRDALDAAHECGVTAVIQPGGSKNDDEIIAAANEMNISMVFTGMRHFRH